MRFINLFFGLVGLALIPLAFSSPLQNVCLERYGTGDKLLITEDAIYYTDHSNAFNCFVFYYNRDDSYYHEDRTAVRGVVGPFPQVSRLILTGSQCFVPGPAECREPASYVVKVVYPDNHVTRGEDSDHSYAVLIGTDNDVCCNRNSLLIGKWFPSTKCPNSCNCSDDCSLVTGCLTRKLKGKHELSLYVNEADFNSYDGSFVVSCGGDCFKYPFDRNSSQFTAAVDKCEPQQGALNPIADRRRCDDPEGTYFCSIRYDTATLYYYDDFCKSRTLILGATWQFDDAHACATSCRCPVWL